jgi:glutaredoxin
MFKRKVEVFTAGCPLCDEAVERVEELACPDCKVTIYDLSNPCKSKECLEKVKTYGVSSVPTIVIDGKIADCCERGKPDRETLLRLGLGQRRAG